jgi:hypothetical protein
MRRRAGNIPHAIGARVGAARPTARIAVSHRLAAWHWNSQRLAGSRLELYDVDPVALRAGDRDPVLWHGIDLL